jgi:outer membrane biosynthesis protein TonB
MKLFQYIQGERKGKAINHLEKEAMKDPFLADALEGFDKVTDNDHVLRIEEMRAKILHQTQSGNNHHLLRYLSIAASFLLVIGFGGYFLLNKNQTNMEQPLAKAQYDLDAPDMQVVENEDAANKELIQASLPKMDEQAEKTLPAQEKAMKPVAAIQAKVIDDDVSEVRNDVNELRSEINIAHNEVSEDAKIETATLAEHKVKGIVTDTEGNPLPGVTIRYTGTNTGTVSDMDGLFELPVAKEKAIQIDYLGYMSVNLVADTNKTMLVAMKENTEMLNEAVVVAYGTQKKSSAVSAASPVKEKSTKPQPVIGEKEYKKYLKKNKIEFQSEDCKGKKGKVKLKFSIDTNGRPTNIRVEQSLCPEADKEAIRLIEQGPDWTLGDGEVEIEV